MMDVKAEIEGFKQRIWRGMRINGGRELSP
jgi:hypothetical protein